MRLWWVIFGVIWPGMAVSDGFSIDFETALAAQAEQVETLDDGTRLLRMETGIEIRASDQGVVAIDRSGSGAVGCYLGMYAQIASTAQACDLGLDGEQLERLDRVLGRLAAYYAKNTVPVMTDSERDRALRAMLKRFQPDEGACSEIDQDTRLFMTQLVSPPVEETIEKSLEVPRLPVVNPCL